MTRAAHQTTRQALSAASSISTAAALPGWTSASAAGRVLATSLAAAGLALLVAWAVAGH